MTNVLIIEDDPMVAMLNQQYIMQENDVKNIKTAKNTTDAMTILKTQQIDLILLDVYLPGMTGLEFLELLREQNNETAVILITAADDVPSVKKAISFGVVDYLIKPFNLERFKLAIKRYKDLQQATDKASSHTNQSAIDQFFLPTSPKKSLISLPKGLAKLTLEMVYQQILKENASFSTQSLASHLSLSRISTKKYILFLVEINVLGEKVMYQDIGRPITYYFLKDVNHRLIRDYLPNV
ncbi:transcriptional regulatory protein [Lactococcus hodotermopsidis]|uniref:Transcriptional regulatory protein n=1 Tax=Pseudolactococcus hodotermopsidis TaxID=2709157 RepID=A0A6A0BC59_9LACT|nr:response regulator [Lactococcus hodotermopsidis]GFH42081.1 transcriptional regulatory protein [Lactococcus hodotermopsidis]